MRSIPFSDLSFSTKYSFHPEVARALRDCQRALWSVVIFSGAVNLLMLAGPLYMLQIYDRVLSSKSVPTLIALSIMLTTAYAFQGAFDLIRSRIVVRAARLIDDRLSATVHAAMLQIALQSRRAGVAQQPVRDMDQIRSFLTSSGPIAIVDLPWIPVYLVICFLIHPALGLLSLLGGACLFAITLATEWTTKLPAQCLAQSSGTRAAAMDAACRNSETAIAMGMSDTLAARWKRANASYLAATEVTTDITSAFGSLSKTFRMFLQSAILGLGAFFVIQGDMSAGAIIAASIMMGRALAPVETAIASWRGFVSARQSTRRLSDSLASVGQIANTLELPPPKSKLEVSQLCVVAPTTEVTVLRDVFFALSPGEALGIIGPSGAGKTSLIRSLAGLWPSTRGTVRIDGATLQQWDRRSLGRHIGFAAQAAELFDGTIAENIARMERDFDKESVFEAAAAASAHEMILRFPHGYNTAVGEGGIALSAGQRQRVSLARALYGNPFLILLDEPHSNLDAEGEHALTDSILSAKNRGAIIIMVAHRPTELATCDKVLVLSNGAQQAFGPRDEILQQLLPQLSKQTIAGPTGRVERVGSQ
jgi:PrtD family type I secretion system ABC transporter